MGVFGRQFVFLAFVLCGSKQGGGGLATHSFKEGKKLRSDKQKYPGKSETGKKLWVWLEEAR